MNIKAYKRIGGVVGYVSTSKISDCYAIGKVEGTSITGGLIGQSVNSIATNSYWIKETTGQNTSDLGTAKTISQLVQKSSYTSWNFTSIWDIEEGSALAYLRGMEVPSLVYDLVKDYPIMEGEGTKTSPYLIKTVEQLQKINADMESYYKLGKDIDLENIENWLPIGSKDMPFTGTLDGAGYTIRNMKIDSSEGNIGLFGYTEGSTITNLDLTNYNITASGENIGSLVGYNQGTIINVSTTGTITTKGTVKNVGGLVGNNESATITSVSTNVNILLKNTSTYVGGLVGIIDNGSIINKCYSRGTIQYNSGSYGTNVGGIAGYAKGSSSSKTNIENIYSSVNIKASNYIGGLIGYIADATTINNAYAIGNLNGGNAGGIIGRKNSSSSVKVNSSYWSKETTGQATSVLGEPKTISQLVQKTTYGWNFTSIWAIDEGTSLPYLRGMEIPSIVYDVVKEYPIMEGQGTSSKPYIIKTTEQLANITADLQAYYKLGNDINLENIENWVPIGTSTKPFTGTLDGEGYTIRNMKIENRSSYLGLFGYTDGSTITNLKLNNYNIASEGSGNNYIGALVGYNQGNVINVSTSGTITIKYSSNYVGGLVGYHKSNKISTEINKCCTEGTFNKNISNRTGNYVGGLVGLFEGKSSTYPATLSNSYSNVDIKAYNYVGGLIGKLGKYTTIQYSYMTGNIDKSSYGGGLIAQAETSNITVTNCYWDKEKSGQTTSANDLGTGLTTEEMKTKSSYSGWNFTNIWKIEENEYPTLQ